MEIKELFKRPIDRNIQGVIKVDQDDEANVKQELDEYVVTSELRDHFEAFFNAFDNSLQTPTDDMGVWISGFFGSGKSHFLKIISYILANKVVDGKNAVDYFDDKIDDQMILNEMHAAASAKNDVILFNIDAKAKDTVGSDKQSILKVFMRVFNEMQGFTDADFWIADLERQLTEAGKLDAFKEQITAIDANHKSWEDLRDAYYLNKGTIKAAMINSGFSDEANAQGFIDTLSTEYQISIDDFAELVKQYIDKTGHRVVFLADEVGQFIGDSVQRMLNLQTIVEQLGTMTRGKAWVVVTSQQAIDKVTDIASGQDFSKIQGRFKTRLSMSSANVDEVIRKRLLEKTDVAEKMLEDQYSANAAAINNSFDFDDDVERPKYESPKDFAQNYPFVPYQFNLLQFVLTAIRENGSDGKHLSEGERSMLSLFQESAEAMMSESTETLAPFSRFFDGLDQFLDHTHHIVLVRAHDNPAVNPNKEKNPFALQLLKVLFMVKYVSNFTASLNNLITLMISSVDADRIALKKQVQDALDVLVTQGYVEKTVKGYDFLTDAEQDITREISKQEVTDNEVAKEIGDYLFNAKPGVATSLTYPKLNGRYVFAFNRKTDNIFGAQRNKLSVHIITPVNDDFLEDNDYLRASAGSWNHDVLIALPRSSNFVGEIRNALRIQKFVVNSNVSTDPRYQAMVSTRQAQQNEEFAHAHEQLIAALDSAEIYENGQSVSSEAGFDSRLEKAMKLLVDNTYRSLQYITVAKSEKDIRELFENISSLALDEKDNQAAVDAVLDYMRRESQNNAHITMESVLSKFNDIPYGYTDEDIQWLVAKLVAIGKLKMFYNGKLIDPLDDEYTTRDLAGFFTKKQAIRNLAFQIKEEIAPSKIKAMQTVASEVFGKKSFEADNDEQKASELKKTVKNKYDALITFEARPQEYPGHAVLQQGIQMLRQLLIASDSGAFYDYIGKHKDDLLDWNDDFLDDGIRDFYYSDSMQKIWDKGLNALRVYRDSNDFLSDSKLQNIVDEMGKLLRLQKLQGDTAVKISELNNDFDTLFTAAFDKKAAEYLAQIDEFKDLGLTRILESGISDEKVQDQLRHDFENKIQVIRDAAKNAVTLNQVVAKPAQADAQLEQLSKRIKQEVERIVVVSPATGDKHKNVDDVTKSVTPANTGKIKPKDKKFIKVDQVLRRGDYKLEDSADVAELTAEFKRLLEAQLSDNTIVTLQVD
ncbi:BREX system P-loop protein BrxC [Lacticaseibacillus paracasei]|uniref:BREX system P-loop protein BrxC n=2 Tax=Lacticaseibacillus paracasei TaxID=1597 RepID=A0A422M8Z4_LACPA|nr:BREX system P-loop protein BrxC [Lacticaseibacillus paracasei]MCL4175689.1 BREX system P-loop protein BrxC [Lacticaseibacillus paracasei]MCO7166007.1 BREX system P-loop protein BrxC [Lacticaseibacillus paracasei]MCU6430899.1 BREX system P-loop protein BrxC [Lacticaseibacillus paracasei]MDB7799562.1 BREX system P-loop protein BrxC [Lacticaseibacillus paracasei]MDB7802130.1 BREX system P-loop protein BrxC [Lacticaseibacillus paracasei]